MVAAESGCDAAVLGKLHRAVLPISCLMIGFCYLDRSNVAYMQLQLQHPRPAGLDFSDSLYGNASGLFFMGYSAFQIPSNLILVRQHSSCFHYGGATCGFPVQNLDFKILPSEGGCGKFNTTATGPAPLATH